MDKLYAVDLDTHLYLFDKKVIMDELGKKPRPQLVPLLSAIGGICEAPPPGNHIYYTDNHVEMHSPGETSVQDMGIFNLEDLKAKKILPGVEWLCPPTWLLP
ncbi:hypothetical protein PIB30_043806 [Stylosanthes scabra]|uniref:Uncharacterized protein n=1 Tax=Stylosanthes scabra TaxID=79078 RepID=A0ABU6TFA8_9FABA|nr:hypothetical protein [Stylosanthes scabra]